VLGKENTDETEKTETHGGRKKTRAKTQSREEEEKEHSSSLINTDFLKDPDE